MTFQGELTTQDWLAARREFLRVQLRDSLWLAGFFVTVLAILLCFHIPSEFYVMLGLMSFIPRVFLFAEYPYLSRMSQPAYLKLLTRSEALPGPRQIEIDPEGITLTGPHISRQINWKKSYRSYQIGRDYILVFAPIQYQIFPRRWFTSEQLYEFEQSLKYGLIQRHWLYRFWPSS